jgi:hypothetical protein
MTTSARTGFALTAVFGGIVALSAVPACGSDDANIFAAANDSGTPGPGFGEGGTDPNGGNGGGPSCGSGQCAAGQACSEGQCSCPPYTSFCNGTCIPTVNDPDNCGACGVKCTGSLACSGGTCAADCLLGLVKCGNRCVDTKSDNNNCGACGATPCGPATGCVDGTCRPAVPTTGAGPTCTGGGASPVVDGAAGGCAGNIAQTVFRWTLCSCADAQFSESWLMDGYDSTKGPYAPGGLGAGFGANGNYGRGKTGELWGTMWIAGAGGIDGSSFTHTVKTDLRTGGELKSSAAFTIGKDAYALGNVSGSVSVAGTLFLPAGRTSSITPGKLEQPYDVKVPPPCDFCKPEEQVPIARIVDAHVATNDNATIGLQANALSNPDTPMRLDLPCGHYYLTDIKSSHHVTVVAHGRTALYITGDVQPSAVTFTVDPVGELNVFIKGSLNLSGALRIGSPAWPAAMRVYVAGTSGVSVSDNVLIAGNLYAPNGPIQYSSAADQYGAIYAGNFSTSKDLRLHYDRAIVSAASTCGSPNASQDGGSSGGAPGPGSTCDACRDCGNQACGSNGQCGGCTTSDQCCAPLACIGGTCALVVR